MSLISDALKKAQRSKAGNTPDARVHVKTSLEALLQSGILSGGAEKSFVERNKLAILGILVLSVLASLVYVFILVRGYSTSAPVLPGSSAELSKGPAVQEGAPAAEEAVAEPARKKEEPARVEETGKSAGATKVCIPSTGKVCVPPAAPPKKTAKTAPIPEEVPVVFMVPGRSASVPRTAPAREFASRQKAASGKGTLDSSSAPGAERGTEIAALPGRGKAVELPRPKDSAGIELPRMPSVAQPEAAPAAKASIPVSPSSAPQPAGSGLSEKALNNLGVAAYLRGDLKEAEKHIKAALALDPENSESYINLGIIYKKQNRLYDALKAYKKALAIKPDAPEAYYNLGILYDDERDFIRAAASYQQFLRLATERYQAQKRKVQLRLNSIHPPE